MGAVKDVRARAGRFPIRKVLSILRKESSRWNAPVVTAFARHLRDPYRVLVGCLLSLRTKDETTGPACERLFALASTPEEMVRLSPRTIENAIFPVGFYRTKARTILEISRTLIERYGGKVPDDLDELLSLKGVGRKTANLVLTEGFRKPGICVDTHVHRISNRWGFVRTKNPVETEAALRRVLPKRYWIEYNALLVAFGQTICKPTSPLCSRCPVEQYCAKVGVRRAR
ncbi:MAG: endonuclease III [Candidatus Binatia bacterium]|nr:MAG: endonuclease III [Candidatus Binatia bacterium]